MRSQRGELRALDDEILAFDEHRRAFDDHARNRARGRHARRYCVRVDAADWGLPTARSARDLDRGRLGRAPRSGLRGPRSTAKAPESVASPPIGRRHAGCTRSLVMLRDTCPDLGAADDLWRVMLPSGV